MTDGLMRRFNLVYSEKDGRDFTDYSIYNENKIRDEVISEKNDRFFLFYQTRSTFYIFG